MDASNRFDMAAVLEGATVVQASLFDDVVHLVHERGTPIPTCLNVAGSTDVVVGPGDTRAAGCPTLGDVSWHPVATLFQQREEFQKFAGVRRMHRDVEAISRLHLHHQAVAIGINCVVRFTL